MMPKIVPPRRSMVAAAVLATALPAAAQATPFACPSMSPQLTFAMEAEPTGTDMHFSTAVSTREMAMNFMESLIARSENNDIIPQIAESWTESPDHLTYTFKLRDGISFHNGQKLSSEDVLASFQRYAKIAPYKITLQPVSAMGAPDALTFTITLGKVTPSFLEQLSSFAEPVAIYPASERDKPGNKAAPIGTGPFRFVEWVPDSHYTLERFPGYQPQPGFDDATGFGGRKVACVERVIARSVKEPAARVAGLETGAFDGIESLPTKDAKRLMPNAKLAIIEQKNFTMPVAIPNLKKAPTDKLEVRQAIQAALDLDAIEDASFDGAYALQPSFQYPDTPYWNDGGKALFNQHNAAKAKQLLQAAGYKGEPVVLLTNTDYDWMYVGALVMAEQLKSVGINAVLNVTDWPGSQATRRNRPDQWNLYFTGWTTGPSIGPRDAVLDVSPVGNLQNLPSPDPDMAVHWADMQDRLDRSGRLEAFKAMQTLLYEKAYVYKLGDASRFTGTQATVKGYRPYRIVRFYNVWLEKR